MTSTIRACSALTLVLLAGCTTVVYRPVPLPLAKQPVLTPIKAGAFKCPFAMPAPITMCISDKTYDVLVDRERKAWDWGASGAAIIKANNAKATSKAIPTSPNGKP